MVELPIKPQETYEKKAETESDDLDLGLGLSPEQEKMLEHYIGQTVQNLLGKGAKEQAIISGELTDLERKCMSALYVKSCRNANPLRKLYKQYLFDYMLRTVPRNRQRESAVVKVLSSLQEFKRITFGQGVKNSLLNR